MRRIQVKDEGIHSERPSMLTDKGRKLSVGR